MARTINDLRLYGADTPEERRRLAEANARQTRQTPTGLGMGRNGYQPGLGVRPPSRPIAPVTPRVPTPTTPRTPTTRVPTGLGMGRDGYQEGVNAPTTPARPPGGPRPTAPTTTAPRPRVPDKPWNTNRPSTGNDGPSAQAGPPSSLRQPQPLSTMPGSTRPPSRPRGLLPRTPPGSAPNAFYQNLRYQNESVSDRLANILDRDSPLMQRARTRGYQAANQRGLLNSSLGVQAGEQAMIETALPIAQQEAQQAAQTNRDIRALLGQDLRLGRELTARERADRVRSRVDQQANLGSLMNAAERNYRDAVNNITSNEAIPASERQRYLDQAAQVRNSTYRLLEQIYGIRLSWSNATAREPAPPAPVTTQPTTRPGGPSSQLPPNYRPPGPGGYTGLGFTGLRV